MYRDRIAALAPAYDPRHIEAYMRVENNTLDWMSAGRFACEVEIARQCVDGGGREMAERLAQSYGM